MIAVVAAVGASVLLAFALTRLALGPTLWDRALAAQSALLKLALVAAACAVFSQRADWVDVSFALVLGLVVFNVAALKFHRVKTFQAPLAAKEGAP